MLAGVIERGTLAAMANDPEQREPRVTQKELHANPSKVFEQARGGRVVIVDDEDRPMAILSVPTDERPLMFK